MKSVITFLAIICFLAGGAIAFREPACDRPHEFKSCGSFLNGGGCRCLTLPACPKQCPEGWIEHISRRHGKPHCYSTGEGAGRGFPAGYGMQCHHDD